MAKQAECDVCGTVHQKADGIVHVSQGKEWRFCSHSCRQEWRDQA